MLKITKSLVLSLSLLAISTSAFAENKKVEQYEMQSPPAKTQSAPATANQMPVPVGEPIKVEGPRAAQLLREGAAANVEIGAPESGPDPLFIGIFSLLNTLVPFAALVAVVCGIIIIRGRSKAAEHAKTTVVSDNNATSELPPTTEPQPESKS